MKFQYAYVSLGELGSFGHFLAELERRGNDGWELCGFEYGCAFFKRVVPT